MKTRALCLNLVLFLTIFVLFNSIASTQEQGATPEIITLYVPQMQSITVDIPTRIAIGNPKIADITAVDEKQMTITAKNPGATNLIWWDKLGEHAVKIRVYAEDMSEIKFRIDALLRSINLPSVYTRAVDSEGKVLLLGRVRSEDSLKRLDTALGQLKKKTINLVQIREEEASIEIDVQVLELNKDATETLGFTWPGALSLTEATEPVTTAVSGWSALFQVSDWTRSAFSNSLDLLVQEGKARILSRPRLACQSGKEAELLIGGEKPIMTTQVGDAGGEGTEVEYKEYGIKLKIRPKLIDGDRISLGLNIEVSDVGTAEILGATNAPTARAYPLSKRTTVTELYLDNGQTMAISGLIKQKTEKDLRELPWLADIPVLGLFFRHKETKIGGGIGERGDTELVITLTPTVIAKKTPYDSLLSIEQTAALIQRSGNAVVDYKRVLTKYILSSLIYPLEAKAAGLEGVVVLNVHLSSAGELLEVSIARSSGSPILDNNSINMFRRVSRFPSFPKDIKEQELWLNIPIVYNLE